MMRVSRLAFLGLTALMVVSKAQADEGVPALLQFAEQYQRQNVKPETPESDKARNSEKTAAPKKKDDSPRQITRQAEPPKAAASTAFTLRRSLVESEQQLTRQQAELDALRQEITALRAEKPPVSASPVPPDMSLLQQWLAGLSQAWRGSPDAQRTASLLQQAQQDTRQAREAQALAESQLAGLTVKLSATEQVNQGYEQKLARQQQQLVQAQIEATELGKRQQWEVTAEQLKDEKTRLSYAAGSALGRDIDGLMAERQSWGVPVDRNSLLAGVLDAVSGHLLLPPAELAGLMEKADSAAGTAREKRVKAQVQQDQDYLARFSKQKGVKQSAMGFWYRVDYAGDHELAKDAVIDVVVKERLTDGTVIQDMELSGKVLSQPLSAYPPLFREAIGHLRNHGSLTMVVPPEFAYGEAGYPPKVPPNATMVYELRIDNSQTP
ncbi:FKBP-type peptidyl-prolyl cis-trans isomerase fkpA precursor [Serratia proteamaculans]|nr:FKBP-type peptidyl-prolyl cis-trans isomerase fkpA precursor [Serratia proteamaculans]